MATEAAQGLTAERLSAGVTQEGPSEQLAFCLNCDVLLEHRQHASSSRYRITMTYPSYSLEEAREILLDQVITLEAHIYLEGRREEYVRAEDYDRIGIIRSSFQHIWSSTHPEWDWEKEEPTASENSVYCTERDV